MPRLILTTGAGASTADVQAGAVSLAGVQDAVQARQADAVIVSVPELSTQIREELANVAGVTGVHEDLQGIPLVASGDEVQDFLNRVGELRGQENVPLLFETEPTQPGEPIPDGGAIVLPVPSAGGASQAEPTGPITNAADSLSEIGVGELHGQGIRGEGVISVVVDTGACGEAIRPERQLDGADLTGEDDPWSLMADHGGMSTGLMAGGDVTPGIDLGVLPESDIFPIKTTLAASELIQAQDAIVTLADRRNRPVIVNNSWGFPECGGICDHPVTTAIENAAGHPNVVQVFAAGNSASGPAGCGQDCDGSTPGISGPNSLSNVVTVAASGQNGEPVAIQAYSSRGGDGQVACGQRKPDVAAPVFGTMPWGCGQRDMGNTGGTSAAAPQVAGVVGLLAEATGVTDAGSVMTALEESAIDIQPGDFDGCSGAGLVDAAGAAQETQPTVAGLDGRRAVPIAAGLVAAGIFGAALRQRDT